MNYEWTIPHPEEIETFGFVDYRICGFIYYIVAPASVLGVYNFNPLLSLLSVDNSDTAPSESATAVRAIRSFGCDALVSRQVQCSFADFVELFGIFMVHLVHLLSSDRCYHCC